MTADADRETARLWTSTGKKANDQL